MTTALQQTLESLQSLAEELSPEEQATLQTRLEDVKREIEEEREWDRLLNSPASVAYLTARSAEIHQEHATGQTRNLDELL